LDQGAVTPSQAVLNLPKDLPDLVFQRVRAGGPGLEAVQVGEELGVDELDEVVAGEGGVVVNLAVLALGRGPCFPAVGRIENGGVFPAVGRGLWRCKPAWPAN
jgi:hypothetical protein